MITSRILRAPFVQKTLSSKAAIADYLATPSWASSQLFATKTIAQQDSLTSPESTPENEPVLDSKLVAKLVRQAGLPPVPEGSAREQAILADLRSQLVFVDHICEVETQNLTPLVRLGDPVIKLSFENMATPIKPNQSKWVPTSLASEKNASFYVLKEGLRHED
ncbi:uncharacterized protein SAPINGB_P002634 [Magnusiomyces paraingens]|uniref:Glutamyl-tRNA(Gln) amidotransferase subunit F, mitochondrial n=1 Tax=Magnusiomyces paraingens TaxID=2606893 RepID=A0A5E8BKP8_9ASCO|nr:uncharacterized protein SAPINGB_P002634 [Saprochaete ingens]VVT50167.1 unnamed protein product [Saprochaete ingens]